MAEPTAPEAKQDIVKLTPEQQRVADAAKAKTDRQGAKKAEAASIPVDVITARRNEAKTRQQQIAEQNKEIQALMASATQKTTSGIEQKPTSWGQVTSDQQRNMDLIFGPPSVPKVKAKPANNSVASSANRNKNKPAS